MRQHTARSPPPSASSRAQPLRSPTLRRLRRRTTDGGTQRAQQQQHTASAARSRAWSGLSISISSIAARTPSTSLSRAAAYGPVARLATEFSAQRDMPQPIAWAVAPRAQRPGCARSARGGSPGAAVRRRLWRRRAREVGPACGLFAQHSPDAYRGRLGTAQRTMLLRCAARPGCALAACRSARRRTAQASAASAAPRCAPAARSAAPGRAPAASALLLHRARPGAARASFAMAASVRRNVPQPRTSAAAVLTRAAPQASATTAPEAAAPPQPIYLKDYAPPPFTITAVHLDFNLGALPRSCSLIVCGAERFARCRRGGDCCDVEAAAVSHARRRHGERSSGAGGFARARAALREAERRFVARVRLLAHAQRRPAAPGPAARRRAV